MQENFTLKLTSLFVLELLAGRGEYHILIALTFGLSQSIRHTLPLAVSVQGVFVQAAFNVNIMNSSHVDDIQTEDRAWALGEGDVDVQRELHNQKSLD